MEKVDVFMPFFVADYLRDTGDLSLEEHGAYVLLLIHMWGRGRLPADHARLARVVGVDTETFGKLWPGLSRFFEPDEEHGFITQKRLARELEAARARKANASENGKRGAEAKKAAASGALATPPATLVATLKATLPGLPPATPPANQVANGQQTAQQNGSSSSSSSSPEEEEREPEPDPDSCAETARPSSAPAEPALVEYPTDGRTRTWGLTQRLVNELQDCFPSLDVMAEAKKAKGWVIANKPKRKTAGGMPKFLFNWMQRAQENPRAAPARASPPRDLRSGHAPPSTDFGKPGDQVP